VSTIAQYPDETNGGPRISKLIVHPIAYEVDVFKNEDGGADVNVQPCGPRKYELIYDSITTAQLETLRTHVNLAKEKVNDFSFYNRQTAATLSGFHYQDFRVGKHKKTWARVASVTLVRFE
jgi:hypothetical protein